MKTYRLPLKITTVTVFLAMICAFVAYRVGAFEQMVFARSSLGVPVDGNYMEAERDTPPPNPKRTMMYSSKSGSVEEPPLWLGTDSTRKDNVDPLLFLMPSSKSGRIITPRQETPQQQAPPANQNVDPKEKVIMPSSKVLAPVIKPEQKPVEQKKDPK